MRQPLIRFIDRLLGPDDLVAVMTPEMGASDITFGRKTTVISKMLEREWTWGRRDRIEVSNVEKEQLYERCYGPEIAREMKNRLRETKKPVCHFIITLTTHTPYTTLKPREEELFPGTRSTVGRGRPRGGRCAGGPSPRWLRSPSTARGWDRGSWGAARYAGR